MGTNLLFTIAIPAYKGRFLKECIASILAQTYENFELIIVNDFSPDAIDGIISQFNDERIKYFRNGVNIGAENLVYNWNECLKKASGDFFIMMGDDDKMAPDFLKEFVILINKYPNLDVFHCRSIIIDEDSKALGLTPSWPELESVYENIYHRIMDYRLQYISDFVYRTAALINNGGFYNLPLAWGSDDISAFMACGKKGIAHTNKPVFFYRNNSASISSSGSTELKLKAICLMMDWFTNFLKAEPTGYLDKIVWGQLKGVLYKRMQKRKIYTLSLTLGDRPLVGLYHWAKKRKKYGFSLPELCYAFFQDQISKFSKSKY